MKIMAEKDEEKINAFAIVKELVLSDNQFNGVELFARSPAAGNESKKDRHINYYALVKLLVFVYHTNALIFVTEKVLTCKTYALINENLTLNYYF